ncbi:response regulator [Flaviaesturariibacter aridisoli]|uniref:Response regulator transcription factor n=1 Tax=Flaviaesturariibacter aridisoli TaxID=2545761 RepID=A0A4R4E3E8_9BACT|nr:response regulator transcription factor [Flaviaesturariibacter aridisoli]TCZ73447.1 response regulator transcription factor [Flaviaesturariibacter aridisoli]
MLRILIADDHPIVRRGLREILQDEYTNAVIVEVSDADAVIVECMRQRWDLVISDISMPGRSGLEMLYQLKEQLPHVPVLMLSVYPEEQYAARVLKAGAVGYLNKDMAPQELVGAVRKVLSGSKYITPTVAEKLLESLRRDGHLMEHEALSDREFEVFRMLASGMGIAGIAEQLKLSSTTISTYRARILTKMGARSNADLVRYAMDHSLL